TAHAAEGEDRDRSDHGGDDGQQDQRLGVPASGQKDAADQGADDGADAAHTQSPAHAGGADSGRIDGGGQGVAADLGADDAEAGQGRAEHQDRQIGPAEGQQGDEGGGGGIGAAQHQIGAELVDHPSQDDGADDAAQVQGGGRQDGHAQR